MQHTIVSKVADPRTISNNDQPSCLSLSSLYDFNDSWLGSVIEFPSVPDEAVPPFSVSPSCVFLRKAEMIMCICGLLLLQRGATVGEPEIRK
jgi:hypothetical protein